MPEGAGPQFFFKIVGNKPAPEQRPEVFPLSDLDKKDGFVHLSDGSQVAGTADLFFGNEKFLYIVRLSSNSFGPDRPIKWEGGFPHLYGNFGKADMDLDAEAELERRDGQTWKEVIGANYWFQEPYHDKTEYSDESSEGEE